MKNRLRFILYRCVFAACFFLPLVFITACDLPQEAEPVVEDNLEVVLKSKSVLTEFPGAGAFVLGFTNPYLAFEVGKVFHYEGETEDGLETIEVTVTSDTKEVMGVVCTVVRDIELLEGDTTEKTDDWFAEDEDGNVWYFGEYSEAWDDEEEEWSTEGSWEAGVDGAMPGILMFAVPKMGKQYQQEYYEGEAEDMAKVINLNKTVEIEMGTYEGCLETMEWTPLEPGEREHKFYKPGIGLLLELEPRGGRTKIELVEVEGL